MQRRSATEWLILIARVMILSGGRVASYFCLTGMLVLVISDPFLRYIVGRPFYWSNEVSTFLMVMMVFAGLGVSFAKGRHVRVTLIFDKLPRRLQNVMWIIVSLATLFYAGILAYAIARLAVSSLTFRVLTSTAELPFFPFQMLAALGLVVFFVALVVFTVKRIGIALGFRQEGEEGSGVELGY